MTFSALHRTASRSFHVTASPDAVFPLLCPVREREWIPGWDADVLHSRSGLAELGCVFVARLDAGHEATYVVTRYEPPRAIAFAIFHGTFVETLQVELTPANGGTDLLWSRVYTGLGAEGNAWIEENVPGRVEARLAAIERLLQGYLDRR